MRPYATSESRTHTHALLALLVHTYKNRRYRACCRRSAYPYACFTCFTRTKTDATELTEERVAAHHVHATVFRSSTLPSLRRTRSSVSLWRVRDAQQAKERVAAHHVHATVFRTFFCTSKASKASIGVCGGLRQQVFCTSKASKASVGLIFFLYADLRQQSSLRSARSERTCTFCTSKASKARIDRGRRTCDSKLRAKKDFVLLYE
jgi:hypothetical protein